MPEYIRLQFLPGLDSYGVPFHAVVVFGLGFEFFIIKISLNMLCAGSLCAALICLEEMLLTPMFTPHDYKCR